MPELPDITVYRRALQRLLAGQELQRLRLRGVSLLRSVEPPIEAIEGRPLRQIRRLGKRLVFAFEGDLFLVLHLMIAGRLRWRPEGTPTPSRGQATFAFPAGTLTLTEAGSKKRATLHLVAGEAALRRHDPGGVDIDSLDLATFREQLTAENRTLKRRLTDPHAFSGIGNAYSDEILHAARLSPLRLTQALTEEEIARLLDAAQTTLGRWTELLWKQTERTKYGFPEKVTAFHPKMAVHGRFGEPCPTCGAPVQRIVYAENETNYCAACQNEGRLLADRSLSRLLKKDWPRRLEEWD
jgi:formamidopyrimidine-DNA glycosylase